MSDVNPPVVPVRVAVRRVRADHELLLTCVEGRSESDLADPYPTAAGPLGDGCVSLHDLVAHVLMWDELNLAALAEARAGRRHWSLDPGWDSPEVGRRLNAGGLAAGRLLPGLLLLDRFRSVSQAVLAELDRHDEDQWVAPTSAVSPELAGGIGALAQRIWTVPGYDPFWHAAIHLRRLPDVADGIDDVA